MRSPRRIVVLFGTRPEAIKLGPVIPALERVGFEVEPVTTGQHRELVDDVLPLFGVTASGDLALMRPRQSLDYILGAGIERIGAYLGQSRPAAVVIQGDTTSALAAALASFHHRIPVGHVEAGLRTHDLAMPFPEEMNRRLVSSLTTWHFAPTERSAENLAREGFADRVQVTGNTVVDAVRLILDGAPPLPDDLSAFINGGPYLLATAHRRESWGVGIASVAEAMLTLLQEHPRLRIVFAVHPNPEARRPVRRILHGTDRVKLLDAIPYPQFLRLLAGAAVAVSDSGGVQEEGPTLGVPVVVTRSVTERPEGLLAGAVRMSGTDHYRIVRETSSILDDPAVHRRMAAAGRGLYGDGRAAERIAVTLAEALPA